MPSRNRQDSPDPRAHGLDRSSAGWRSGLRPFGKKPQQIAEGARISPASAARRRAWVHPSRNEEQAVVLQSPAARHAGTEARAWCIKVNELGSQSARKREKDEGYGYSKRDRLAPRVRWGGRTQPLSLGDQEIPDPLAGGRIYARQALARAWRYRGGGQAGQLAPPARRQDRHGLSRLRPPRQRADQRRQYRPDAGREE